MVAVSKHSSSLSAVKWAIDNKLHPQGERVLKLVHVRPSVRFIPSPSKLSILYIIDCMSKFA